MYIFFWIDVAWKCCCNSFYGTFRDRCFNNVYWLSPVFSPSFIRNPLPSEKMTMEHGWTLQIHHFIGDVLFTIGSAVATHGKLLIYSKVRLVDGTRTLQPPNLINGRLWESRWGLSRGKSRKSRRLFAREWQWQSCVKVFVFFWLCVVIGRLYFDAIICSLVLNSFGSLRKNDDWFVDYYHQTKAAKASSKFA